MDYKELKEYWLSDVSNYTQKINKMTILKMYFKVPGFKYSFWLRLSSYFLTKNKVIYKLVRIILMHYSIKFGIEISPRTKVGRGLAIFHFGGIVINGSAVIGNNLNIRQGVTIGNTDEGVPIIGDNVYIGVGGKVIGNVKVGNNVKIGANAVVLKDVPNDCSAVGVPARNIQSRNKHVSNL